MTLPLVPCPACARHVAIAETACPFCASALPTDLAKRVIPGATGRLSRAAAYAFTASLAVAACSSDDTSSSASDAGKTDAGVADGGNAVPLYGAPVTDAGGGGDSGNGDGGIAPLYGAPVDAGSDAPDSGASGVLYGLPPADAGNG